MFETIAVIILAFVVIPVLFALLWREGRLRGRGRDL
jgi:hypothetical protein